MSKKTGNNCDVFCFQQCSDKYQELIVRRQKNNENMESTKVSLKKSQTKNNQFSKIMLNTRSQSQKDLHNNAWKTSTNRSKDEKNGNAYDIELFRKKNKIQGEIEELQKQMKKLSIKYEQRLNVLSEIREEIKDRKSIKDNGQKSNKQKSDKRIKVNSAFQHAPKLTY